MIWLDLCFIEIYEHLVVEVEAAVQEYRGKVMIIQEYLKVAQRVLVSLPEKQRRLPVIAVESILNTSF